MNENVSLSYLQVMTPKKTKTKYVPACNEM